MNFFERLQSASSSVSKLHRVQKDILKQKKRSKLQRQISVQKKIDLDKGFTPKENFDQE